MTEFSLGFVPIQVTANTIWLFVSLDDGETVGWGEATLDKHEQAVTDRFNALPRRLSASDLDRLSFDTLADAALSSALQQAHADLVARRDGQRLSERLGGVARDSVGVYANINRCSRDRSPESMAANARRALEQGHIAIKIAPFDEVKPTMDRREMTAAMEHGLNRIDAVRNAIGDRRLMVDCHWRFDHGGAGALIDACVPFGLHWIECPIEETPANIPTLVALRGRANGAGMRLAGLETAVQRQGFAEYLAAGAYDVMMPDVKYCGGPQEMMAIAADMARHGVVFSPHNPTGPICHAHSIQVCAALPQSDLLETQFDETPMFQQLVNPPPQQPDDGLLTIAAQMPGIGCALVVPQDGATT